MCDVCVYIKLETNKQANIRRHGSIRMLPGKKIAVMKWKFPEDRSWSK